MEVLRSIGRRSVGSAGFLLMRLCRACSGGVGLLGLGLRLLSGWVVSLAGVGESGSGWHGDEGKKTSAPAGLDWVRIAQGGIDIRCTFDGRFAAGFFFGVPVVLRALDGELGLAVVDCDGRPLPTLDAVLTGIVRLRK